MVMLFAGIVPSKAMRTCNFEARWPVGYTLRVNASSVASTARSVRRMTWQDKVTAGDLTA